MSNSLTAALFNLKTTNATKCIKFAFLHCVRFKVNKGKMKKTVKITDKIKRNATKITRQIIKQGGVRQGKMSRQKFLRRIHMGYVGELSFCRFLYDNGIKFDFDFACHTYENAKDEFDVIFGGLKIDVKTLCPKRQGDIERGYVNLIYNARSLINSVRKSVRYAALVSVDGYCQDTNYYSPTLATTATIHGFAPISAIKNAPIHGVGARRYHKLSVANLTKIEYLLASMQLIS